MRSISALYPPTIDRFRSLTASSQTPARLIAVYWSEALLGEDELALRLRNSVVDSAAYRLIEDAANVEQARRCRNCLRNASGSKKTVMCEERDNALNGSKLRSVCGVADDVLFPNRHDPSVLMRRMVRYE